VRCSFLHNRSHCSLCDCKVRFPTCIVLVHSLLRNRHAETPPSMYPDCRSCVASNATAKSETKLGFIPTVRSTNRVRSLDVPATEQSKGLCIPRSLFGQTSGEVLRRSVPATHRCTATHTRFYQIVMGEIGSSSRGNLSRPPTESYLLLSSIVRGKVGAGMTIVHQTMVKGRRREKIEDLASLLRTGSHFALEKILYFSTS
jgi:hypothetical protein